ncbi:MAG TPA: hypothetical protein VFV49_03575, partial [Thermoanaerobaculia bacterium]|nr:hypothetical protein [Thermoanaerobaculia bacterium]
VRIVFRFFVCANEKRCEVAAHESFSLAGPTGLEPATSGVRVPQVLRDDEPEPWTRQELAVLMGPALRRYEKEQREWNAKVATEKQNRGKRSPSFIPLRGLCSSAITRSCGPKTTARSIGKRSRWTRPPCAAASNSTSTRT